MPPIATTLNTGDQKNQAETITCNDVSETLDEFKEGFLEELPMIIDRILTQRLRHF